MFLEVAATHISTVPSSAVEAVLKLRRQKGCIAPDGHHVDVAVLDVVGAFGQARQRCYCASALQRESELLLEKLGEVVEAAH